MKEKSVMIRVPVSLRDTLAAIKKANKGSTLGDVIATAMQIWFEQMNGEGK